MEKKQMNSRKLILVLSLISVFNVALVAGIMSYQKTIGNLGNVKTINIEAYWDEAGTQEVSTIDWGILEPNMTKATLFYLRNTGNSHVILSMQTANWNPVEASSFIVVSWGEEGTTLDIGEQRLVIVTLVVSISIHDISGFTFDMILEATG